MTALLIPPPQVDEYKTTLDAQKELPLRRYTEILRQQAERLRRKIGVPPQFSLYPQKEIPFIFSRRYGPISPTTVRRNGTVGFEGLAPVAQPQTFILPNNHNILVGLDGPFVWRQAKMQGLLTWTWAGADRPANTPNVTGNGGLFDDVISQNGGAIYFNNFSYSDADVADDIPNVSWELELFDKKRGRYLHDGRLSSELFSGQSVANKQMPVEMIFDPRTEIEPRLYITEARVGTALSTDALYNAANVKFYLNLMLIGARVVESPGKTWR